MDWFLYHNGLRYQRVKTICEKYKADIKIVNNRDLELSENYK